MRTLYIISALLFISSVSFAQITKKDTLKTEEITVVKPYTPTISDAFKININPTLEEMKNIPREKVNYSIFSVPVASTFTPSKGKATSVARAPKTRLFENYISAGFGNYSSPLFELFLHTGDNRYSNFGIFIKHHSSEGGIKNLLLNDNFSDTKIDGYYKQYERYFTWKANVGYQRQLFNYYGLPDENFNETVISDINEKQLYNNIYVGGEIAFEDSFFKGGTAKISNFSDDYNSNEINLKVKPVMEFPLSSEKLITEFDLHLLAGKFKQSYYDTNDLNYSFLNLGFSPNFEVIRKNLTLNLGAKLYYGNDLEHKTNAFYIYPNVTASFTIIDEIFMLEAGVTGDLKTNSYSNFVSLNPYVSPTLEIEETDEQYKAYLGIKGKLASNLAYHFKLSHASEKNKPLFIQNPTKTDGATSVLNGYEAGNSFNVIYDDIKTLSAFGEITLNASKELDLSMEVNYSNYSTTAVLEAFNLPTITSTISANYSNNKWFAGAKLYFNSETKDFVIPFNTLPENGTVVTNKSYTDLNFNGGYVFSDRLTAFAKVNNALGNKYHRFVNYQVQELQILAGITYKFDL